MRASLYARVSTEEQTEGYSIEAQRRAFRNLCQSKDWIPQHEYIEGGKSAHTEDMRKRPVFKQAIDDAVAGQYDVLVVHKIDRFSRKLKVTLEYFEKLGKAGVGFVSIENDMDYSTPQGKFMLVMQGGLAELYSDNLSQETKKGWHERRKQGLYCGALPFGAMKGEGKVPVPDNRERETKIDGETITLRNYDGLEMAFELAGQGKSDREIAVTLNSRGYRTTGTHGPRLFSKDTVRGLLQNRFYIGEIPDGNGGWLKAQHQMFVDEELFEAIQIKRRKDAQSTHKHSPGNKKVHPLTGITYCWYCREQGREGRIHISSSKNGKTRLGCYNRIKGWDCPQKSVLAELYEQQLRLYLATFKIPEDYQRRILEMHSKLRQNYDVEKEHNQLNTTLARLKELYKWGDITKSEYTKQKHEIEVEILRLQPLEATPDRIEQLAELLADIINAWDKATGEQRNKLVRTLFQEIWVKDEQIVAVKPQPEFEPFFGMNWEEFVREMKSNDKTPSGSPERLFRCSS